MLVWMLRFPGLVLVEVRKPSLSFLLANAVSHANTVIMFPVVHNKPTWCYPLNTQSDFGTCRQDIQTTYPFADVNKKRNLHALFQAVVLNGNSLRYRRDDRLVLLELRIFGINGPYHRF